MNYQTLHQMNLQSIFGENPWEQEDTFLKDRAYRKRMFSDTCRQMCDHVADVCDSEEYDGSCMYDEYPDPTAIERLAQKAYAKCGSPEPSDMCRNMVTALLYDEICYRRCRRRNFKRQLQPR